MARKLTGPGISIHGGGINFSGVQRGFAAKITSSYSSQTGYDWERLVLVAPGGVQDGTLPLTGAFAYDINGDTEIEVDTKVWLEPDGNAQGYVIVTGGGSTPTPEPARCITHGWLKDREALKKKWFTVGIRGGEVGTRCECVPDQFTTEAVAPYDGIAQAPWDSSTDKWELLRTIETCCGCAKLSLDVTTDGQLEATITMTTTCDSSTPKTITQKADCYMAGNKALFTFGGLKLCNNEIPTDCESLDCDQSFEMEVDCACCELETFDCVNCLEGFGPALWRVIGVGFTGSETDYNDIWYLPPSDTCTWSITCGTITVTLVVAADGITVTFQGAGATIIYKFDAATGGVACIGDYELDWDSGDDANSPATIDIEQVSCLVPCDLGAMRVSSSATICGTLWTDQMMFGSAYEVSTSSGGGSNDPECEPDPAKDNCKGYGVIISCNPDGTFNVFPYCSPSPGPCYSGPPVILNIPNEATYPDVLFSITYTCDDPDCAECPVSQTLTFTNM